jgi:hypothetical protein
MDFLLYTLIRSVVYSLILLLRAQNVGKCVCEIMYSPSFYGLKMAGQANLLGE